MFTIRLIFSSLESKFQVLRLLPACREHLAAAARAALATPLDVPLKNLPSMVSLALGPVNSVDWGWSQWRCRSEFSSNHGAGLCVLKIGHVGWIRILETRFWWFISPKSTNNFKRWVDKIAPKLMKLKVWSCYWASFLDDEAMIVDQKQQSLNRWNIQRSSLTDMLV